MDRPKNFKLDHKSLCSSCNSYVIGEHQPWCETVGKSVISAAGRLLAAEAEYLHAAKWIPHVFEDQPAGDNVRWLDPLDGQYYRQGLAVASQRKRDKI